MVIAQLLVFVLVAATPGDWFERLRSLATMSLFIQWVAIVDIALLCGLHSRLARLDDQLAALAAQAEHRLDEVAAVAGVHPAGAKYHVLAAGLLYGVFTGQFAFAVGV
jgi:hypothetical protein